jgi:hypothetical protein
MINIDSIFEKLKTSFNNDTDTSLTDINNLVKGAINTMGDTNFTTGVNKFINSVIQFLR